MLLDALRRASGALRGRRSTAVVPFEGGDAVVVAEPDLRSSDSSDGNEPPGKGREAANNRGGARGGGGATSSKAGYSWTDTPEVVPETARPRAGSPNGEQQRQLAALRDCCETLEERLEESQQRVLQLEVELRSERLLSRRALDEATAARVAAERPLRCRNCGCDCSHAEAVVAEEPRAQVRPGRIKRVTQGSRVAFEDCPEVITVEIEGEMNRESRSRQSTGASRKIAELAALAQHTHQEAAAASGATSSDDAAGSGRHRVLKKSRDRVPTGSHSLENLQQMGILDEAEEAAYGAGSSSCGLPMHLHGGASSSSAGTPRYGGASSSTAGAEPRLASNSEATQAMRLDGSMSEGLIGWEKLREGAIAPVDGRSGGASGGNRRRARGHAMSCHILVNSWRSESDEEEGGHRTPDASRGVTMVLPPNLRSQEPGSCPSLPTERGKARRASSIASFHSGSSAPPVAAAIAAAAAVVVKQSKQPGNGGTPSEASSCSTVNRAPISSDQEREKEKEKQRRLSQLRATAFMISTMRRKKVAFTMPGDISGCTASSSIATFNENGLAPMAEDGKARRSRKKTHSTFVPEEVVACALGDESRRSSAALSALSGVPPPAEPQPPLVLSGRLANKDQPGAEAQSSPREHAEHLAVLGRYSRWRVQQALPPDEPSGVLTKGGGSESLPVSSEDMELLNKAVPELAMLGFGPEVSSQCFRAFKVESGEVLWCEDEPTEYLYVVGAGASLSLTRFGRVMRDVAQGEGLGTEALQKQCRWGHTATVKCEGEVWALEVAVVRELLVAVEREDFRQLWGTLANAVLFKQMLPIQLAVLAAHAEVLHLKKDECLVHHAERRAAFFVLTHGALVVHEDGHTVRRYSGVSQSFGERALMDMARGRETKVVATEPSSVLAIHESLLSIAIGGELTLLLQRSAVRQVLRNLEAQDPRFAGVQTDTLESWAEHCSVQSVGPGEDLLGKALSGMLVVLSGEISATEKAKDAKAGPMVVARQFEALGYEHLLEVPVDWLASLSAGYAGATVASLPKHCHSEVFEHCARLSELVAYQKRVALVREIFIFRHLSERQFSTLVRSMTMITRQKGEAVVREGDQGADFYIIHEGDVHVSKNSNFITKLCQPSYFGERALLYEEPRAATVTVASESATFCVLTKRAFLDILNGGILDFIAYRNKLLDTDLQFSDLEMQKVIGRGGYGIVKLVRHKSSGTRYALKCVTREKLSDQDRSLVQRERAILQLIDHPFCLKLVRSFKDDNCVYFLTELVTGGELLDALDRLDVLNLEQAQFYFGSLVLIFEYIHQKHVVYRDLKPENVLLDQDGFIKLIDFGAARRLDSPSQKCYTLLGTPYFMATEMLLGKGYDMRADIWALGVCLYEFVVGRLPFDGDEPEAVFRQVASRHPVHVPEDLERRSADMLRWLLQKDPNERPETSARGYKAIREHRFFEDFNFEALINRGLKPPIVPQGEQYSEELSPPSPSQMVEAECPTLRHAVQGTEVDGWDAEF